MNAPALVGTSPLLRQVRERALQVASADVAAIITGESGTGKEVVARFIHAHSRRARRPFVAINCAALSDTLIESELFGHRRGAFTGALADRAGCFEQADTGTLLLDEVTEIRPQSQAKLLRVLQESEVRPLGATRVRTVDVRAIATSNLDLDMALSDGLLREDLYYRLSVVELRLPSLRERKEDIPALASHFLLLHATRHESNLRSISAAALDRLVAYDWAGNVRQLENAIVRTIVFAPREDTEVLPKHLNVPLDRASRRDSAGRGSNGGNGGGADAATGAAYGAAAGTGAGTGVGAGAGGNVEIRADVKAGGDGRAWGGMAVGNAGNAANAAADADADAGAGDESAPVGDPTLDLKTATNRLRRRYATEALRRTNGSRTEAAAMLGITRRALYDLLSKQA
jgi:DNA-binding NtrC family response regulator